MKQRKPTKAQLNKIIRDARKKLNAIEDKERIKDCKKYAGKFYKYNNSYSMGDRWWLYIKVTDVSNYWPKGLEFQTCSDGKIEIEISKTIPSLSLGNSRGYIEITEKEFNTEWNKLLAGLPVLAERDK